MSIILLEKEIRLALNQTCKNQQLRNLKLKITSKYYIFWRLPHMVPTPRYIVKFINVKNQCSRIERHRAKIEAVHYVPLKNHNPIG